MSFETRALAETDCEWVRQLLQAHWGDPVVVSRGRLHHADRLPGFIALRNGVPMGLLTFHIDGDQLEVVTLNSLEECQGIGTALLQAAQRTARAAHCRRLWLITTNDNVRAREFYTRRGLAVAAIHQGAIDASRKLKPQIPQHGIEGVPVRDEIEFALPIEPAAV
jgi:ribosomal protein S18 acetylase RimI-like enzyme